MDCKGANKREKFIFQGEGRKREVNSEIDTKIDAFTCQTTIYNVP